MAATSSTESTDGPVLTMINKRIRNLRKKQKRIAQIEEAIAQGKPINKEQEDVLNSKIGLCAVIEELEKLRNPISVSVSEEIDIAVQLRQQEQGSTDDSVKPRVSDDVVEDLLNLLYFGSLFDVKTQNDFTSTMFTRTHERGSCLTYDYVTDDDAADLLGEGDLDMISKVGGLVISRPVDSRQSHKNALQQCIEHAKRWIEKSDEPIESDSSVTYANLRERLSKIMGSDYFTTTPEMKAPVDVAAAAGNYASYQVLPVQVDGSADQYQQKVDDAEGIQSYEVGGNQSSLEEALQKAESMIENPVEVASSQLAESEQNQIDVASKDQQYNHRRSYPNQRGGRNGGGRRGYSIGGRGGRSSGRGGGPYQNGRNNQYYEQQQPANYYQKNYYNNRSRGGQAFNNQGLERQAAHVDVGSAS